MKRRQLALVAVVAVIGAAIPLTEAEAGCKSWDLVCKGKRAARDVGRAVSRTATDVGRAVRRTASDVGRATARAASDVGRATARAARDTARWVGDTAKKGVDWAKDTVGKVGDALSKAWSWLKDNFSLDKVKQVFCQYVMPGICPIVEFVWNTGKKIVSRLAKGEGFGQVLKGVAKDVWDDLKASIEAKIEKIKTKVAAMFASFKDRLADDPPNFGKLWDFAKNVMSNIHDICKDVCGPVPFPVNEAVCWVTGVAIAIALTPPVATMSIANWAVRKISKPMIELLVKGFSAFGGAGGSLAQAIDEKVKKPLKQAFGSVANAISSTFGKFEVAGINVGSAVAGAIKGATDWLVNALGDLAKNALDWVGAAAGGALHYLVKDPETKKRIEGALFKVAHLAEKIESTANQAVGQVVGAGAQVAQLTPAEIGQVVDALTDFARDQILAVLDKPMRSLIGKLLSLLNRLLDVPRNAMVAGVGSIPYAGGVLASALNFGLGMLTDMISNFLLEQLRSMVSDVVGESVGDFGKEVKRILASPKGAKAAAGFMELLKFVGKAARSVAEASQGGVEGVALRKMFGDFVATLKQSPEKAKAKLQDLANKVGMLFAEAKTIAKSLADGIGPGVSKFVDDVAACRQMITGFNAESARGVFTCVKNVLQGAIAAAVAEIPRALYDQFVNLLRSSPAQAKAKLRELADKLGAMFPEVKPFADPVVAAIDQGASKAIDDIASCRQMITGMNLDSAKGVFNCVKLALKTAVTSAVSTVTSAAVEAVRKLYDELVNLLKTNVASAKGKLDGLVKQFAAAVPDVGSLAGPVVAALGPEAAAVADDLVGCRSAITGLNRESIEGVLTCMKTVLKGAVAAAATAIPKALYDEFVKLLRSSPAQAKAKLKELADKLGAMFAEVKTFADPVIAEIDQGASKVVDDIASCRQMITGMNLDSAKGVFNCVKLALKSAAKSAVAGAGTAVANAVVEGLRRLYDEFVRLLRTNAAAAKDKLKALVNEIAKVFPQAGSVAAPVVEAVDQSSAQAVDDVVACRSMISGVNRETVEGLFGCVKTALKSAASAVGAAAVTAARALYDRFVQLVKTNIAEAKENLKALGEMLARVSTTAQATVKDIVGRLGPGAVAQVPAMERCRASFTGMTAQSAQAVLGCVRTSLGAK